MKKRNLFVFLAALIISGSIFSLLAKNHTVLSDLPQGKQFVIGCLEPVAIPPDVVHDFKLTGSGFPANKDLYVYGCRADGDGTTCTAGYDKSAKDMNAELSKFGFVLKPETLILRVRDNEPIKTDASGNVNTEVNVNIGGGREDQGIMGRFFGLVISDVTNEALPTIPEGQGNTLQYGTLFFPTGIPNNDKCISIHWDPYGRVFDSKSLEPLPNTTVELLDQNRARYSQVGIQNPQHTSFDGAFGFYVKDGTYYLNPSKSGYQFPVNMADVKPNYAKAYFDLYTSANPIIQKGQTIHVDVPLKPLVSPYRGNPVVMMYSGFILPNTLTMQVEGKISHPLSIVILTQNGKEIARTTADKFGFFQFAVDNRTITSDAPINFELIKVDLTTGTQSPAIISDKTLNPIPRYIEGHAYNNAGVVIPFANVAVKLEMSDGTYYQTQADKDGYFLITPQFLPLFNYYLELTGATGGQKIRQTTAKFAEFNKSYLEANKIDLMTATENSAPIDFAKKFSTFTPPEKANQPPGGSAESRPPVTTQGQQPQFAGSVFAFYLLIVLLLILVVIVVWFILKSKSSQRP